MSDENVRYFDDMLKKIDMPTDTTISEDAREIFERGLDVLLTYRGHPDTLMQALRFFLATESRPYAFAGAALVMHRASYISRDDYDDNGIRIAKKWLSDAQDITPHRFEINVHALIFYKSKDKERRRTMLDALRLHPESGGSFWYALAEMNYWDAVSDLEKVKYWSQMAFDNAKNNIQRLTVLRSMGGIYWDKDMKEEALGLYHEVVKLDPNDPWTWHNMSLIYGDLKDLANAGACNDRALRIMDFGAARQTQRWLVSRWSQNRNPDVLKDVPPYKARANPSK